MTALKDFCFLTLKKRYDTTHHIFFAPSEELLLETVTVWMRDKADKDGVFEVEGVMKDEFDLPNFYFSYLFACYVNRYDFEIERTRYIEVCEWTEAIHDLEEEKAALRKKLAKQMKKLKSGRIVFKTHKGKIVVKER